MKTLSNSLAILFILLSTSVHAQITKMWDFRYGSTGDETSQGFLKTLDDGFLIYGTSPSNSGYEKSENSRGMDDFWIVKTDGAGNVTWDRTYGGALRDNLLSAIQLPDSGYILAGQSESGIGGEKSEANRDSTLSTFDLWIIRIDKNGNIVWDKTIGGSGTDYAYHVMISSSNRIVIAGDTYSHGSYEFTGPNYGAADYWIVVLDMQGNLVWEKNFGGSNLDWQVTSVIETSDGSFLVGGESVSQPVGNKTATGCGTNWDIWCVKMDSSGNIIWDKSYGGDNIEDFRSLTLSGNKIYLSGASQSPISCNKTLQNHGMINTTDFWLLTIDENGDILSENVYGGDNNENGMTSFSLTQKGYLMCGTSYSNASGDKTEDNVGHIRQGWALEVDSSGNVLWDNTIETVFGLGYLRGMEDSDGCFVFLSRGNDAGGDLSQNRSTGFDYWLVKFCDPTIARVNDPSMNAMDIFMKGRSIEGRCNSDGPVNIQILNLNGQVVFERMAEIHAGTFAFEVSAYLASGVYVLRGEFESGIITKKVIIN